MELGGILLRRQVALALAGDHMNQHGTVHIPGQLKKIDQRRQVMTVHRPQILKSHSLKNGGRQQAPLDGILDLLGDAEQKLSARQMLRQSCKPSF